MKNQKLSMSLIIRAAVDGAELIETKLLGVTTMKLTRIFHHLEREYGHFVKTRDALSKNFNIQTLEENHQALWKELQGAKGNDELLSKKFDKANSLLNNAKLNFDTEMQKVLSEEIEISTPLITEAEVEEIKISTKCMLALFPFIESPTE